LYLRNRVVKEQLDRVTLAADLGSDVFSGEDRDQDYIVMGSVCNDDGTSTDLAKNNENGGSKKGDAGVMA
jgi:hypothetical protein